MSVSGRLLAATAVVFSLLAIAPASAAEPPVVEWTRPTVEDNVLDERDLATGKVTITGTVTGEEGQTIDNVAFDLIPDTPAGPDDPCFVDVPDKTVVLDGNSTEDFDLELEFPCNRAYELMVTVGFSDATLTDPLLGTEPVTSSIRFSVAIPPAKVGGFEAGYDEGTREVRLTWARSSEADLLGYFVERNPPGPEGFRRITPDLLGRDATSFTDPAIEDEHRYRVSAVRRGPAPDSQLAGEPSPSLEAGPERTEPTLPDDVPPPNSRPSPSAGRSGGGEQRPAPRPSQTRTTSNIFDETLPFDSSQTTIPDGTESPEDGAVLAEFDDGSTDEDRRATLVPIAGGLALVVGAMHLFLLSKRAGEPDDIPMSRR